MKPNLPAVLGIAPGTRQIGVAVFRGTELLFSFLKTIKTDSDEKTIERLHEVLADLLHSYDITHVALQKIAFVQQHRSFVKSVHDEILRYFNEHHLFVTQHNPKELRESICEEERPTNANTAHIIARRFPELERCLGGQKDWQKRYYSLLLGAVAAGLVRSAELLELEEGDLF